MAIGRQFSLQNDGDHILDLFRKYLVISIIFLLALITCSRDASSKGSRSQTSKQRNSYNVIVIVISTLRADHLGCYGYKRPTSPNIDKLAAEGLVFEQAFSQSNWTLPSMISLFTSKYVSAHSVNDRNLSVSLDELMLAEILKLYEYKTAAFTGGLDLKSIYHLDQGFDIYFDKVASGSMGGWKETIPLALDWLTRNKDDKFFLFLHTYDVHQPYHYPEPYENLYDPDYKGVVDRLTLDYNFLKNLGKDSPYKLKDIEHIIAHYDGGITYADSYIGKLLVKLKRLGLQDKTIIILTADHGEALYDHDNFDRYGSNQLYEEIIHIPLVIKHPGIKPKGKRMATQVQLVDILPTILSFLGIPIKEEAQGSNLASIIEGKPLDGLNQSIFSEGRNKKWALRTKKWKLIGINSNFELYNLEKDPRERSNVSKKYPDKVYKLYQKYLEWYKKIKSKTTLDNKIILDEQAIKDIKEAGYW